MCFCLMVSGQNCHYSSTKDRDNFFLFSSFIFFHIYLMLLPCIYFILLYNGRLLADEHTDVCVYVTHFYVLILITWNLNSVRGRTRGRLCKLDLRHNNKVNKNLIYPFCFDKTIPVMLCISRHRSAPVMLMHYSHPINELSSPSSLARAFILSSLL